MDPIIGRKTWRTLEPYHGAIYFVPEAREEYAAIGIADRMAGYFSSRSASMGAVPASVVIATFYNFDPGLVERSMHGVWDVASPEVVSAARLRAVERMIRRLTPEAIDAPATVEAADIASAAALVACEHPEGRPLFAGHTTLPWPDEPHLVLWHAQTLLREFRGDAHIAALTVEGLSGCEALVSHALAGDVPAATLQISRQRTDADWEAAIESLRQRGWIDADGSFTDHGRERRAWIEARTDELSVAPYSVIGENRCDRLRVLTRPISTAMMAAFG